MGTITNCINNTVGKSNSGVTQTFTIQNTSNTASSQAQNLIVVGGASSGDPFTTYTITGATSWSSGIDNSDSDKYIISASTALGTSNVLTMDTSGVVIATMGNLSATRSNNGAVVTVGSVNTSATAGSDANLVAQVAGSGGDPYTRYEINGSNVWVTGMDVSDSAAYVISQGSAIGTNNTLRISTSGHITKPLQPIFLAYLSVGTANNVTGDGTNYTVICDTATTNVGSSYNATTGVFTAPDTGNYLLTFTCDYSNLTALHTNVQHRIATTGGTFQGSQLTGAAFSGGTNGNQSMSVIAPMTAGDTCSFIAIAAGSTKTVGIGGGASPRITYVSGTLLS